MSGHYVNNKQLFETLVEWKKEKRAAAPGTDVPIPRYVGECIMAIANRLATKPNFSGYDYKHDMIADGIENCIQYIDNFNPDKSTNPFAYFTQIIYYAFLRRIQKEKKNLYVKLKVQERLIVEEESNTEAMGRQGQLSPAEQVFQDSMRTFIYDFEESKKEKRRKRRNRLAKMIDEDNEVIDE